jgi:hypothetical protein
MVLGDRQTVLSNPLGRDAGTTGGVIVMDSATPIEQRHKTLQDNYDRLLVLWRDQSQVIADLTKENRELRERITWFETHRTRGT